MRVSRSRGGPRTRSAPALGRVVGTTVGPNWRPNGDGSRQPLHRHPFLPAAPSWSSARPGRGGRRSKLPGLRWARRGRASSAEATQRRWAQSHAPSAAARTSRQSFGHRSRPNRLDRGNRPVEDRWYGKVGRSCFVLLPRPAATSRCHRSERLQLERQPPIDA